jgi:hypothetical protein
LNFSLKIAIILRGPLFEYRGLKLSANLKLFIFILFIYKRKVFNKKYFYIFIIYNVIKNTTFNLLKIALLISMDLIKYFTGNIRSILGNQMIVKLVLILSPFFFRESIYNSFVTYRVERQRGFLPTLDPRVEKAILEHPEVYDRRLPNRDKIIHAALKVTADFLNFDGDLPDKTDPLSIWQAETVNSTSFATFYTATTQFLLQKNGLSSRYICQQYVAERRQNGKNLHDRYLSPYGTSPFKSERDIVAILDLKTGEKRFVDPTIFEQISIINIKVEGEHIRIVAKTSAQVSE